MKEQFPTASFRLADSVSACFPKKVALSLLRTLPSTSVLKPFFSSLVILFQEKKNAFTFFKDRVGFQCNRVTEADWGTPAVSTVTSFPFQSPLLQLHTLLHPNSLQPCLSEPYGKVQKVDLSVLFNRTSEFPFSASQQQVHFFQLINSHGYLWCAMTKALFVS